MALLWLKNLSCLAMLLIGIAGTLRAQDDFEKEQLDIDLDENADFGVSDEDLETTDFDKPKKGSQKSKGAQPIKDFQGNTSSDTEPVEDFPEQQGNNSINFGDTNSENVNLKKPNQPVKIDQQPGEVQLPQQNSLQPAQPAQPAKPLNLDQGTNIEQPASAQVGNTLDPSAPVIQNSLENNQMVPTDPQTNEQPVATQVMEKNDFAGVPPIPGTLRNLAEAEGPEEYLVEEGDTLFDIGDQLLDEPAYWPKLWALNPQIKNPHFIFPGMRLRFYPGDEESPPYLQIVTEDDVVPIDRGGIKESELVSADVSALLMDQIVPDEIEIVGPEQLTSEDLESPFVITGNFYKTNEMQLVVPTFVYADKKDPLALVVTGLHGETLLDKKGQMMFDVIENVSAGTTYTLLRSSGEIRDHDGGFVGYRYEFVGHASINNVVDGDYAIGTMVFNRLGAQPGDILVEFVSTNRTIPLNDTVQVDTQAEAAVIGFEYHLQDMGGAGNFVVINQNIEQGRVLPVFQKVNKYATRFKYNEIPDLAKQVGVIRIIDTTGTASVGYVLQSTIGLRVGDSVGKG